MITLDDINKVLKDTYLRLPPPQQQYSLPVCSCGGVFVKEHNQNVYVCNVCWWVVEAMEIVALGRERLYEKKIGRQGYYIDGIGVVV